MFGLLWMLPDDLENLVQAAIASTFSANNILMRITSSNYWAIHNEYKPLMHTWSLGIEEQFYLFYPWIFFILVKIQKTKFTLPILIILSTLSVFAYLLQYDNSDTFYYLPYRIYQLGFGGIVAILTYNKPSLSIKWQPIYWLSFIGIIICLFVPFPFELNIPVTIFTTTFIAIGKYNTSSNGVINSILQSKIIVFIGKISFELYLWHQIVFAYARYSFIELIDLWTGIILTLLTFGLAVLTYFGIEKRFRNKKTMSNTKVYSFIILLSIINISISSYLFVIGGVFKDVPSLNLYTKDNTQRIDSLLKKGHKPHIAFNEHARTFDKEFDTTANKIKILVVGNSFGRDFVNVLLATQFATQLQISYYDYNNRERILDLAKRWETADIVFFCSTNSFFS